MEQSKEGDIVSNKDWKEYIQHVKEELDWFHKETQRVLTNEEYSPEVKGIIIDSYRSTIDRRIDQLRRRYVK